MVTKRNKDAVKRCKCKKSKCLKLYCDCFSAGLYCAEVCSCKECFNLRDYEDEVQEARECIEHKDPHAFSPKIHSLEDGDKLMPSVEKHRKGCKCRKSMCMQEYCECYKGKVGCWSNCRCEGCKNVHGMKGGNCDIMIGTSRREFGSDEHEFINRFAPQDDINGGDVKSVMNLSYIPSPDGSSNSDMMIGTSTWDFDMVPLDQDEFVNRFTPQDMNIRSPDESSNHDMMIGTTARDFVMVHVDQLKLINQCTSQDINGRPPSSVTKLTYNPSQVESSNCDMMIGTSAWDYDLDLPTVDQLQFMNKFISPQHFNARHDDNIK